MDNTSKVSFRLLVSLMLAWTFPAGAAARLFLESPDTNDPAKGVKRELAFREIPRQIFLITAAQDFGLACVDSTVEPASAADPADLVMSINTKARDDEQYVALLVASKGNESLTETTRRLKLYEWKRPDYDELAGRLEAEWGPKLTAELAKQTDAPLKPAKWDADGAVRPELESRLDVIDFHDAFLVARTVHNEIAASGESPARLGVLVRAYANLGDSTRHLFTGQSEVFFIRSMVYGKRLVRLAPADPRAWWSAGYGAALYGLHATAEDLIRKGDELAKASNRPSPPWLDLTRDLLGFKTGDLFAKAKGADGAMAGYLAWLTVEHAPMSSLAINFARSAVDQNPSAIRTYDSMSANGGVGLLHQTTVGSSTMLNRVVVRLATDPLATDAVRAATTQAKADRFSVPSLLKLLETLDRQPAEAGQLLPWSVYASLVREAQFVNAIRRMYFVQHQWSVDPSGDFDQWWPVVQGHRYAALVECLVEPRGRPSSGMLQKVSRIPFKDDALSTLPLGYVLRAVGSNVDPKLGVPWDGKHVALTDETAYSSASILWQYRSQWDEPSVQKFSKPIADRLLAVSPNHPVGIAASATMDPDFVTKRGEKLERELGGNPIVAFGLGKAYVKAKRYDEAKALLERVAPYAPDQALYAQLAEIDAAKGDYDAWVKTWNQYLAVSEDFGLEHATVNKRIAENLVWRGKHAAALPYAEQASASYSGWGLVVHAMVLTRLGDYDKAAKVLEAEMERYGGGLTYYIWCRETRHGDLAAAKRVFDPQVTAKKNSRTPAEVRDYGLYQYLEGQPDLAVDTWERAAKLRWMVFETTLAAAGRLEQGRVDDARRLLEKAVASNPTAANERRYKVCATEMLRCLDDASALPSREGEIGKILGDFESQVQRGNIAYFFGDVCAYRKNTDEAKKWYRYCLESPEASFTCRSLAAEALRKLGDEFHK